MATREELRAIIANENLPHAERDEAAQILAELERPVPKLIEDKITEFIANAKQRYTTWVNDQNARFKVCGQCYRKQLRDNEECEQCGAAKWELAAFDPPNSRRCRLIAAATSYSIAELEQYVANASMDTAFAEHCARILELRGIDRPRGFWERAGFDFHGRKVE